VKGLDVFLRVCLLFRDDPRYLFLVAGEGEERAKCEAYIRENRLDNCRLLGHIQDIYSFYNCLDINTLASRTESFPYSLLEGGVMKKATVATAVGGIPEMIEDGVTGLLVPAGDHERLAAAIRRLGHDPELRGRLGTAFYEKIRRDFSAAAMAEAHDKIYHEILHDREGLH